MFIEYSSTDKIVLRKLGLRIKQLRNRIGISQNELALRADIPKSQIGRIERAEINTSVVTLYRIATGLEVELVELFDFSS